MVLSLKREPLLLDLPDLSHTTAEAEGAGMQCAVYDASSVASNIAISLRRQAPLQTEVLYSGGGRCLVDNV